MISHRELFENSVELDLYSSQMGQKISSTFLIEDSVVLTNHIQVYKVKTIDDNWPYLLFAIPKKRHAKSDDRVLERDLVKYGASDQFVYYLKRTVKID